MSKHTHQQVYEWKFNHKHKSNKCKIPSHRFTIILDHTNYSDYNNRYKYVDNKDPYYEISPEIVPICSYDSPREGRHCVPRHGELIINGDFEYTKEPFFGWKIRSGVTEINPDIGEIAHQDFNAARLGCPGPHALLYQDVPGICPGIYYQLNFYMSAAEEYGNAEVDVRLEFLDHRRNLLDRPALQLLIPDGSLSSLVFTGFNNSTKIPAPPEARFARVSFEIDTHNHECKYVHLDDVSLIAIWSPRQ